MQKNHSIETSQNWSTQTINHWNEKKKRMCACRSHQIHPTDHLRIVPTSLFRDYVVGMLSVGTLTEAQKLLWTKHLCHQVILWCGGVCWWYSDRQQDFGGALEKLDKVLCEGEHCAGTVGKKPVCRITMCALLLFTHCAFHLHTTPHK